MIRIDPNQTFSTGESLIGIAFVNVCADQKIS
jgi:hypothetical protein